VVKKPSAEPKMETAEWRVSRGGSWFYYGATRLRGAGRDGVESMRRLGNIGLRSVLDLPKEKR